VPVVLAAQADPAVEVATHQVQAAPPSNPVAHQVGMEVLVV
jgi:hypothetical protein